MPDKTNRDGAEEREELLDELEENHERAKREAAGNEKNPPHTTTGQVTAPKFGSAGSGGAEFEGDDLKKN
jgi:hypothetical protein